MTYEKVRFPAGQLPEDFILALAEHGHTTVSKICDMFSACILCKRTATIAAISLDRDSWLRKSKTGKIRMMLYGLCRPCSDIPDAIERAEAAAIMGSDKIVHSDGRKQTSQ
jgi:hypothetical protein